MSDSYSNEDFDTLFDSNSGSGSGLTTTDVERIATNTFVRGYQALQQGAAVVEELKRDAMGKTEAAHPGFLKRINDPEICRKFIERKPATARAILAAEAGQGTASLGELYEIFEESVRSYETPHRESEAAPAKGAASELSLQQINAMALPDRHQAIQALKDRVGGMSIDEADPANEAFKIERGEQ